MSDQLSLFDARELRDQKLQQVSDNSGSFAKDGLIKIAQLPSGEYTGERIRFILSEQGIIPHISNAWGALIHAALRKNLLRKTGKISYMRSKRSHAHNTPIYEVVK